MVHIHDLQVSFDGNPLFKNFEWDIRRGDNWLIHGESGSGKTTLAKVIARQTTFSGLVNYSFDPHTVLPPRVLYVPNWYEFTNSDGDRNFYYQQRYNHARGSDSATVMADLKYFAEKETLDIKVAEEIAQAFNFSSLLNSQLIELSSGEHKKIQLLKALWLKPQLIIFDQPYSGLDSSSRKSFNDLIDKYIEEGLQVVIIQNSDEYPTKLNRFGTVTQQGVVDSMPTAFTHNRILRITKPLPHFLQEHPATSSPILIRMENIEVRYGTKKVLDQVSWTVKEGERWLLQGPNGSGKSTLLSLVNADHPQAYSHDIWLFGHKRGSGESIWDIKQKIGMISPELHWYYTPQATVGQTLASGLHDSIGLYQKLTYSEQRKVDEVLAFFDLTEYRHQALSSLPIGRQRLVLLARTVIKNPALLILDEPCQGLDDQQTQYFNTIVDELSQYGKTIIYVGHEESKLPSQLTHRLILEKGVIKEKGIINSEQELV